MSKMKLLTVLALGLSLTLGTMVSIAAAQQPDNQTGKPATGMTGNAGSGMMGNTGGMMGMMQMMGMMAGQMNQMNRTIANCNRLMESMLQRAPDAPSTLAPEKKG